MLIAAKSSLAILRKSQGQKHSWVRIGKRNLLQNTQRLLEIYCKIILNSQVIVRSIIDPDDNIARILNPFTLRVPLESIVCYSHTFDNNFRMKLKLTKYLEESCCLDSD